MGKLVRKLLSPRTKAHIERLFMSNGVVEDFGDAAVWADTLKYSPPSPNLPTPVDGEHYVSIVNPVGKCGSYWPSYCKKGVCAVTAIHTYTAAASCTAPPQGRKNAIKYLLHYLGELTQPFHVTERAFGGNGMYAMWDGKWSNMHKIWDSDMPNAMINYKPTEYANYLQQSVTTGAMKTMASGWADCLGKSPVNPSICVVEWINETNRISCKYILPEYDNTIRNTGLDLKTGYLAKYRSLVDQSIARGAIRIARYLEILLQPCA
jgi:hypothetical protein